MLILILFSNSEELNKEFSNTENTIGSYNFIDLVNEYYNIDESKKSEYFDNNLYNKYVYLNGIVSYDNYSKNIFIYFAGDKTSDEIKNIYKNADNFDIDKNLTPYIVKVTFNTKDEKSIYKIGDNVLVKGYIDSRGGREKDIGGSWRWGLKDSTIIKIN